MTVFIREAPIEAPTKENTLSEYIHVPQQQRVGVKFYNCTNIRSEL